jgi:adenylate cyclase
MSVIGSSDLIGRAPGGRKLIAVVYADMVGYSRLIGLDDLGTLERLRILRDTLIDPAIDEHGGRIVQTGGDSLLIAFDSIDGAVRCAVDMQQRMPEYDDDQPADRAIRFRIGINIGDVIASGTDLHGDGVNVAARLQAECPPGGICVSRAVRDHVHGRLDLVFSECGSLSLKNIDRPVEAFLLRLEPGVSEPRLPSTSLPNPSAWRPTLSRTSLMVGSLRNLGVLEEHERHLEGVVEDICDHMAKWGISIIGSADAPIRTADALVPRTIAQELGVGYMIQGNVRGTAGRIAVSLQLIDVEYGVRVWSERFAIELGDAINTRNETCRLIARIIFKKLSLDANRRIEGLPPHEWTPSDLILRGHTLLFSPIGTGTYHDAIRNFEQALVGDPDSVVARFGIARALIIEIADRLNSSTEQDEARAELLLLDILRLDANIPDAHMLMGMLRRVQGRLNDAKVEQEVAIQLSPNFSEAIGQLGVTLICLGYPEGGIPLIEETLRLSPRNFTAPLYHCCLGLCHILLGNIEDALTSLRIARALNPSISHTHWVLAAALGLKGELGEASAALAQAMTMRPELVSAPCCYVISRQPSPAFLALFTRTVCAGLRQAGLANVEPMTAS